MTRTNFRTKIKNLFSMVSLNILLNELKINKLNTFKYNNLSKCIHALLETKQGVESEFLLSFHIKEARKKMSTYYQVRSPRDIFSQLYTPSKESTFFILLIAIFIFIFSHVLGSITPDKGYYQNIIAIHAGIGTIIFALIIFVAESVRDDEVKDRARVLLRESYLYPLAVAEVLGFFIFIAGKINLFSLIHVIVIGGLTLWSLARIIRVLLSKRLFAEKRIEILKERLQESIDKAVDERIGQNILLSKLDGDGIKLEYNPFNTEKKPDHHLVKTEKRGMIYDINFKKLNELAELIEEEAKENGYAWEPTGEVEGPEPQKKTHFESVETQKQKTLKQNRNRYLYKIYHDIVDDDYDTLLSIDQNLIKGAEKLEKLKDLADRAFIVGKVDTFDEDVRAEISGVKDQLTTSILNQQLGKIEELRKLYIELAVGYLEFMKRQVGFYTYEQAQKERHSIYV